MLSRLLPAVCLLTSVAVAAPAFAGSSSTTRIEPRPYYGAVVTVEQGVRVWRPLPPTRHMIINPTGAPVSVNITDVRETVNHHGPVNGYGDDGAYAPAPSASGGFAPGYLAGRHHRFRGHKKHGAAGLPVRPMVLRGRHGRH